MYLTWIAIIASSPTGIGPAPIFISAIKKDYFRIIKKTRPTGPTESFQRRQA